MVISKACKPDNFVSCNSLKHSFTNIQDLCSNFVDCKSFIESNSPDILALCETNLHDSIDSGNFSARCYLLLIQKDSITHTHGLAVHVKEGLPFARVLSLENYADSYIYFQLALLHSVSSFSSIYHLLCCYAWFFILFHLTYMRFPQSTHFLMCLSFETSMSIIRTGQPILVEMIDLVNSVIIFQSHMILLRCLTFLLGSLTVILTFLLFWIYLFLLT